MSYPVTDTTRKYLEDLSNALAQAEDDNEAELSRAIDVDVACEYVGEYEHGSVDLPEGVGHVNVLAGIVADFTSYGWVKERP